MLLSGYPPYPGYLNRGLIRRVKLATPDGVASWGTRNSSRPSTVNMTIHGRRSTTIPVVPVSYVAVWLLSIGVSIGLVV